MCRFTFYKGQRIYIGNLLVDPEYAMLSQSRDATYHPGVEDPYSKRNIKVNGDGFGVAWYCDDEPICKGSCIFKTHTPAWSDTNILNLGRFIKSSVILGHIRAAASGHNPLEPVIVNFQNCHPFKYGRYTFMHNGGVPDFLRIKRDLCNMLSFECYQDLSGSTDSEHIFALFLSLLSSNDEQLSAVDIAATLDSTFCKVIKLCEVHGITAACSLNVVITDGVHVVASRYRNCDSQPPSLYYNFGTHFCGHMGNFTSSDLLPCGGREVIITSGPLNKGGFGSPGCYQATPSNQWRLVPRNHMLICSGNESDISVVKSYTLQPMSV